MNITEETNDYFLYRLQVRIGNLVDAYSNEKDRVKRKEMRKKYKELIERYHNYTGIEVWKDSL